LQRVDLEAVGETMSPRGWFNQFAAGNTLGDLGTVSNVSSDYIPLFFIVSYARWVLGTSEDLAFYMLAILNGGSVLGRTVPYLLGQRVKPIYTLLSASVLGAVLLFCWISIKSSVAAYIVFCILWGFVAGVQVTAPTSIIAHPVMSPSMKVIGTRMGMSWVSCLAFPDIGNR
jgi:fucose permease